MDKRNELIDIMEGLKPFCDEFTIYTGDVRSFQILRTDAKGVMNKFGLGGGNLSIALISTTVLSLLSKTYVVLNGSAKLNSQGDINETDALVQLLNDKVAHWGLTEDNTKEFWIRLRHKLVHKAFPKATIEAEVNCDTYEELQVKVKNEVSPYDFSPDDMLFVKSDVLWDKVMALKDILVSELKAGNFNDLNIEKAIEFIKTK